ncbi:iron export ABC transporter permease subunit FetB [Bacillus sp. FJAT-27264]|uniref:ABC transporter permease n=1 Tax=Paenibacillus sp. (strain DSM 101736 / FJAT-27264) TaxID=1850362 RepID=UPI0008081748|nr:iron export ABC transporter permease subunit FetB [Bacillus sp. FJAT-27264]OBZ14151.1 iron export ABC transporter permease subunit FetB [Bacillus sp. FJAT-27264]
MTLTALSFTLLFVMGTMMVSIWQKLGLEKDIAVGTVRSAVQLLAVGYALQFIFNADHIIYIILIILFMVAVASWNAAKRGKGLPGLFWRIALAISASEVLMMGILLGLHIIKATPQYIIPISGMTIGSAMVVSGLFINHIKQEVQSNKGEIETLLSLGATAQQAMQKVRASSVKFSMIPTIDGMKTVGLVQLPGMMTGMIIAGADPIIAVRYQILIVFSFTASAAITSMLLSVLIYRLFFTTGLQLKR